MKPSPLRGVAVGQAIGMPVHPARRVSHRGGGQVGAPFLPVLSSVEVPRFDEHSSASSGHVGTGQAIASASAEPDGAVALGPGPSTFTIAVALAGRRPLVVPFFVPGVCPACPTKLGTCQAESGASSKGG
jgi:hypothetical protein